VFRLGPPILMLAVSLTGITACGQDRDYGDTHSGVVLMGGVGDLPQAPRKSDGQTFLSITPKPITQLRSDISLSTGSAELFPDEHIAVPAMAPIASPLSHVAVYEWQSPELMHGPLYFEQPLLERFGYSKRPKLQPLRSGVIFFADVVIWPMRLLKVPPHVRIDSSEVGSSVHAAFEQFPQASHSPDSLSWVERRDRSASDHGVPIALPIDESVPFTSEAPHNIRDPDRCRPIPGLPSLPESQPLPQLPPLPTLPQLPPLPRGGS